MGNLLVEIVNFGAKTVANQTGQFRAREVNNNFAQVYADALTYRGPTRLSLSLYRDKTLSGVSYVEGQLYIRQKVGLFETPEWGHRTTISTIAPESVFLRDRYVVLETPLGIFYLDSAAAETTIPDSEALTLLKQASDRLQLPSGNKDVEIPSYDQIKIEVEENRHNRPLGDLGVFF